MNTVNESNPGAEFGADLMRIIEEEMDLRRWKFYLSHTTLNDSGGITHRKIIYDSEWCRLRFGYSRRFPPDDHELYILYGRLHASNEDEIMLWNGEKCYCWHGIGLTHLYFLDGFSPAETLNSSINGRLPDGIGGFRESDLGRQLRREGGPRYGIVRQSVIWKHYGLRLFELFDLRRPDLWEQYTDYLKEYYRIRDEKAGINGDVLFTPPLYKIC